MRELLEKELQTRRKFGCTVDDILDDLAEILETIKKREYNHGYVDCAKTYQIERIRKNEDVWKVIDQINLQICSAENFNAKATVRFYGDHSFVDYIKKTNELAVKVNPIKDESLKLTFDWGQITVQIYYFEEH